MLFSQLTGNDPVKAQLRRMVEIQALPPVLLFYGPAGGIKRQFAEELALHLLGSSLPAEKNPDLHLLFPDKNGMHSIASIRELIQETSLPPFSALGKVFILDHADKMLPASSNALLKTLEEPPAATWFILLTDDASAILPTILSRCRMVRFTGSTSETDKEDPKSALILTILKEGLEEGTWAAPLQKLDELLKEGEKEEKENPDFSFFAPILYWMRDLALLQAGGDCKNIFYKEHLDILQSQAQTRKSLDLQKVYALIERAESRLAYNIRPISLLEECFLLLQN